MQSAVDWLAGLSPWPTDGFGPTACWRCSTGSATRSGPSTRFTSSARRASRPRRGRLAATIGEGAAPIPRRTCRAGHERLQTDPAGLEAAIARVRRRRRGGRGDAVRDADRRRVRSTSTSAASSRRRSRPAWAGATTQRTSSTRASSLLTNVGLEHTEVLGSTREAIAAEKLAVAGPGATVVLARRRVRRRSSRGARRAASAARREAAEAFLGRPVEPPTPSVAARAGSSCAGGEVRDGAHTPEAADWLLERLPEPAGTSSSPRSSRTRTRRRCSSGSPRAGDTLVATRSSNDRALPAAELAERGRAALCAASRQSTIPLRRSTTRAALGRPVLVTGSLYLLADLAGKPETAYDVALRWTHQRVPLRSRPPRPLRRAGVRGGLCARQDPACDHRNRPALGSVHDFFHSSTWYVIRNLVFFFVLVFWVATVYWVYKDARRRITDPLLVWVSTLLGAIPLPRAAHLHALPAAGVPRGRARARARDQGDRAAPRGPRPALPGLPRARSRRTSSSARSARRSCGSRACSATSRSRRSGRSARTARRRSSTTRPRRPCSASATAATAAAPAIPVSLGGRMAVERTLILAKPDAVARSLAGEILARFERRGLTRARGPAASSRRRELGEAHYAEHKREAVLRRARRLHHLGADARVRARGRGRDRDVPQDDRRHEPGRRRRRARCAASSRSRCRTTSCTARTRPSRPSARSGSGSPMDWRSDAAKNRALWTETNARVHERHARPRTGRSTRSRGASGGSPTPSSACSATWRGSTSSSSAAAPRTSRRGSRSAARGRSASTSRPRSSRPRGA